MKADKYATVSIGIGASSPMDYSLINVVIGLALIHDSAVLNVMPEFVEDDSCRINFELAISSEANHKKFVADLEHHLFKYAPENDVDVEAARARLRDVDWAKIPEESFDTLGNIKSNYTGGLVEAGIIVR